MARVDTVVNEDPRNKVYRPSEIGHITSVAVNKKFRGLGVAQALMGTIHQNFACFYEIDVVSLYCRVILFPRVFNS